MPIFAASNDQGQHVRPEIVESYRDFQPPPKFRKLVEDLLESVPSNYLAGLKTILLTNQAAMTRDQCRQKIWSRNRKTPLAGALGLYYDATRSRSGTVWLYVDNILKSQPVWTMRVPFLCYLTLSETLYHEIGHHIHAVHRPVYKDKENVADDWRRRLSGRFYREHYWYLLPILYPLALLYKLAKRVKKMTG